MAQVKILELVSGTEDTIDSSEIIYVNLDQLRYDCYEFRSETYNNCIGDEIYNSLEDHEKDWHNNPSNTPFISGGDSDTLYEIEILKA
ncbi:MAG: hypothetical protein GY767_22635 [Shimia sp.]|nr:hypothetical protein [Shimia sp.]